MTSVTGSFSSSAPRRSAGASSAADDGSPTPLPPPRSRAVSTQSPIAAASEDTTGGVLFYSAAKRRLGDIDAGKRIAPPYGMAARRLRERERPGASGYGKIVEFELDVPAAVHSTITALRQRGHGRPPSRPVGAPRSAHSRLLARMGATTPREPEGSGVVLKSEYITQLEARLGTSGPAASPHARRSHDSWAPRHGAASRRSISASVLHHVDNRSHTRQRPRESTDAVTPPLRVPELTKEWVQREEEERASTAPDFFPTSLPLAESPRPAGATRSPEQATVARLRAGKFRPYSAPQPPAASRTHEEGGEAAAGPAQPPWRRRLLTEPIQSYRVLHDATTVPTPTTPSARIPLLGSGQMRRRNVEELRHGFEYERFRMHGELEDRLEWRQRCRAAVLRRASATGSDGDLALSLSPSESAASAVASQLLDGVFGGGSEKAREHLRRTNPIGPFATSFRSAWAQEAARQAVRQEKARLVALLRSFVVTCSAAALTLAATEELRTETIRRVWHPKSGRGTRHSVFFLRDDFLAFLQEHYQLSFSVLLDASEALRPTDIIDTLPSQAEASFAAYAYDILPAHTSSDG